MGQATFILLENGNLLFKWLHGRICDVGRRSQVVRQGSAKPLFAGSSPAVAFLFGVASRQRDSRDCLHNRGAVAKWQTPRT